MVPDETSAPRADAPTETRTAAQVASEDRDRVEAIFTTLDKLIRGQRLYQGGGPLVERLLDELDQRARVAIQGMPLTVRVASFGLVYKGWPISIDDKRIPYLFKLFCDGVRELTLLEGVERDELRSLAEVLGADTKGDDDLVTSLWQRNFAHVRYYAADTFTAGVEVGDDGEMVLAGARQASRFEQMDGAQEITLSPDDIRMLGGEGHLEWVKDAAAQVHASGRMAELASRIRSSFQTPVDIHRFVALGIRMACAEGGLYGVMASPLVLDVYDAFLAAGQVNGVCEILTASLEISEKAAQGGVEPVVGKAADALISALALSDRMKRLVPLVERDSDRFLPVLERMVNRAREGLVALLTDLSPGNAQSRLHVVLTSAGVDLTEFYHRQLSSEREEIVIHAIRSLGDLGTPAAIKALSTALSRNSTPIRKAALEAMIGKYHPEARIGLARALRDPSAECRLLSLQVLATSGDNRVAWGLMSTVQDASFAQKAPQEQAAFYRALASFSDPRVHAHFKEILGRKNVMRSRTISQNQILAARALGEARTPEAQQTLEEYRGFRSHPREVHQAIEEALAMRKKP